MRYCAHPELVEEFQKCLSNLMRIAPYVDQETRDVITDALDTAYDMIFPPEPARDTTKGFLVRIKEFFHA